MVLIYIVCVVSVCVLAIVMTTALLCLAYAMLLSCELFIG